MAASDFDDDSSEPLTLGEALLTTQVDRWTAELAMKLLPETDGPKIEIFAGRVVVSPHAGVDRQIIGRQLAYLLHQAARPVGLRVYPEINIIDGDDLYIPDVSVLRKSGAGQASMDIADAVMLVEIASDGNRRKDIIDRPRVYAAAKVPWFMRIEFRRRGPTIPPPQLVDCEDQPRLPGPARAPLAMTPPLAAS